MSDAKQLADCSMELRDALLSTIDDLMPTLTAKYNLIASQIEHALSLSHVGACCELLHRGGMSAEDAEQ
jgi:hypothetical protein